MVSKEMLTMKTFYSLLLTMAMVGGAGCGKPAPTLSKPVPSWLMVSDNDGPIKWDKGWKTDRVVAEYWPKAAIGYSLKFTFPKNENDADRSEISDAFEDFDCGVYEGGGFPGAPAYVSCDSVTDNASADARLKRLLPALEELLIKMSASDKPIPKSEKTKAREAAEPKTTAEWIARENAKHTKCEGDGWRGSESDGYESWSESCAKGVIVYSDTTKTTQAWLAKEESHKHMLAEALVSRCLTPAEFKEVTSYGFELYVQPMVQFYEDEVRSKFNAALQTQQILQQYCASTANHEPTKKVAVEE